ncbi:hypothetical protein POTOM_059458 [Populus tomentosa]|uniref:Protein kinase domain-containing protein n=1 Tax=Populus tomentosa TaxID=118781 RepID=A0A8X7XT26_POPTO|nr:hypothetical protein POTOM_059458 [Populus tomentosa]
MDGGQILLSYIKVWVVLLLLSATFQNSKLAAKNTEQDKKRKLAEENSGLISIDCGAEEDYRDNEDTGISYKTDKDFISTGKNKVVAPEYSSTTRYYGKMLNSLRIFPEGKMNCYTLKPSQGKNQNYYVRAFFHYGNYDSKNHTQIKFDLYFGVNYWDTVKETIENKYWLTYEIIHYSVTDTIYVCLVNTGSGVPFINGLDLLFLKDSPYGSMNRSLIPRVQADLGGHQPPATNRYPDDVYARIWWLNINLTDSVSNISTKANIDIQGSDNPCRLPVDVLRTAVQPRNGLNSLSYSYKIGYGDNPTPEFLVFFHFAEIEQSAPGERREFTITLNDLEYEPFTLEYLKPLTIRSNLSRAQEGLVRFSINATLRSDLPPILNAFEIFELRSLLDGNPDLCKMNTCEKKQGSFSVPVIASVISVSVLLLLSIITIFWRLKRGRLNVSLSSSVGLSLSLKSKNQPFTYTEIVSITNNFQTIIGEGGFGKVYLGNLNDGRQVAVKLLSQSSRQGYKEFLAEVQLLMIVHHRNLVSLVGYCNEKENMALVYEYMANGNLKDQLLENNTNMLNWRARLQIAVDAAQGLEYLHNGCRPPIVHRDLKSSNILLTENLQAKIADFGLSKAFANEGDSHVTTVPAGTPGYIDPEFRASGNLNKKSDVYSFGILLCELITGQPPLIRGHQGHTHILQWVSPLVERGDIQSIIDPRLQGEVNTNCAWKALEIALSCVPPTSIQRPDMSDILGELKECLAMEMSSEISMRGSVEMSLVLGTDMAPNLR